MSEQNEPRGYTINRTRRLLDLHKLTVDSAISRGLLDIEHDENGIPRIAQEQVEAILNDMQRYEAIASEERINTRLIAAALQTKISNVRRKLKSAKLDPYNPSWESIRGRFGLPQTLPEFRQLAYENQKAHKENKRKSRSQAKQRKKDRIQAELQRRAELRAQLMESFPAWDEDDRTDQKLILHVGPPNSGKTHESLNELSEAGNGWYLAPLRLLAWEVFDRLNQRGVRCNLLTGEEHIEVEGARITAATIEMFNPNQSGDVIIIDEAQMLADPDRGWAWTRAMTESRSPEIHVIASPVAQTLINKMAEAANLEIETVEHERLTPIQVADEPWSLRKLPAKTILVAFSRKKVLTLKTRLEKMGRTVSVVYGSLPPEVRRKQAERFAGGETEICVATDAVGMGLNLPADHVCFYEIEKYDGRQIRKLLPGEVQQIGGRAGRYGFSNAGLVGATSHQDLKIIRRLFYASATVLTHARVAPRVEELEMIPGSLSEKLQEWSNLESIPEELRGQVKTADMTERIELAAMLTNKQVAVLGLDAAVTLVNAPTRKSTRDYWYDCAQSIIEQVDMPLPPFPGDRVVNSEDLEYTEHCISCADIYLWLSHRREFHRYADDQQYIHDQRQEWSEAIDEALLRKIRTAYRERRRY